MREAEVVIQERNNQAAWPVVADLSSPCRQLRVRQDWAHHPREEEVHEIVIPHVEEEADCAWKEVAWIQEEK